MKQLFRAVLFGLLICSTSSATTLVSAEASKTSDTVFRLRDAYKAFFVEYGYFPPAKASVALRLLQGEEIDGFNWRKIVFWEARRPTTEWIFWTSLGDLSANGDLIDGWGRSFRFDLTEEGLVIWSTGPKGIDAKAHAMKSMRGAILIP